VRAILRLSSVRLALAASALMGLALAPSPLFGVHGVESALVTAVVLAPLVAAAGARLVVAVRRSGTGPTAPVLLGQAVRVALAVWLVPVAILALNALRIRQCSPLEGLAFMVLGPGIGLALAAITGLLLSAALPRSRTATATSVLVVLVTYAAGLHGFWATPGIAVFNPYAGWFPGTIYDEEVSLPTELLTFRVVSAALLGALAVAFAALWDPGARRLRISRVRRAPLAGLGALALAGAWAVATAHGAELGHRSDEAHIVDELGATERGQRCIVHAPRELDRDELQRLVADCDFRVARAEQLLGVTQPEPVQAFVFRSASEKRRLMGAGSTYIAKPWRNEVYLQRRSWPHPVLAHEVAHVVAGQAARGPWRVSGRLGGWLPNPALIEGVAVALTWKSRQGLTPHQWARAMLELGRLPRLDQVFGLSFMLQPPSNAYTAAGSFVRFLRERHGPEAVRRAHRRGQVAGAVGVDRATLDAQWRDFLREVPLPQEAMELARLRFERRSIFSTICPHRVAQLHAELAGHRAAGSLGEATETCKRILSIDPADLRARAALVGTLAHQGNESAAREQLKRLRGRFDAPAPVVARARERLADAAWLRGRPEQALAVYRKLLGRPQTEGSARGLEVKVLGIEASGRQATLVRDLLVHRAGKSSPSAVAVHLARELSEVRADGLGPYLEARQLYFKDRFDLALSTLEQARARGLPTDRLTRETERLRGIVLFATGRLEQARQHWKHLAERDSTRHGRRIQAREWLARIAYAQGRQPVLAAEQP
jgi:tetratricopeptide (TPR) repeat protein